jgi:hypothetical protein
MFLHAALIILMYLYGYQYFDKWYTGMSSKESLTAREWYSL